MSFSDTYKEALSCAIRHIGIATYSSGKIRVYLIEHGFSEDVAGAVVSELIEREYINDRKASRKVIISRTGKKQESRDYIYKRLIAAGISEDTADEVVSELDGDDTTCLMLFNALGYDQDSEDIRDQMIKTAQLRGYSYECASKVYGRWSDAL